jgi:hypothetical protein
MVRDNYARMSNEELTQYAAQNAHSLTPEAQEILKDELRRRNMDNSLVKAVDKQNERMTVAELDAYCEKLRSLPCPSCGGTAQKLNATLTSEVMSFLIITHYKRQIKIACPRCLDRANNSALTTSLLLGWWGFPWGIIRTIQAIGQNSKKQNHFETPNDYLRSFAYHNIGRVVQHSDSPRMLQKLITER